ncbi:LysR family transcriptional regulator [Ponticoccus litoralis]|uniref:LysR family transcriptional regulator n=1 Tax=Ponticoccus litoralis TaxID=422297 RepID=A0AAW9S9L1_9RHOB
MAMDTTALKSFLAVAEMGSFTVAAAHLNLSQSTVSGHIRKLEERLQAQLFNRTTRRCELTTAGEALCVRAQEVVGAADRLIEAFVPSYLGGAIRLGIPEDYHLFPAIMAAIQEFLASVPKVSVSIDASLSERHRKGLRDGYLDLAVMRRPVGPDTDPTLARSPLVWIADPGLDLDGDAAIPLAHVSGPCQYFRAASAVIEAAGDQWRSACSCSTLEGVRAGVRSGLGVGAMPIEDCTDPSLIRSHPRLPPLPQFSLIVEVSSVDPPVIVRALADRLRRFVGQVA